MSWRGSGIISASEEERLAAHLADQLTTTPLVAKDLEDHCRLGPRKAQLMLQRLTEAELLRREDNPRCVCGNIVLPDSEDPEEETSCDLCGEKPSEVVACYFVKDPSVFGAPSPTRPHMPSVNFTPELLDHG